MKKRVVKCLAWASEKVEWLRRVSKLYVYVKTIDPILAAQLWKPIYKRLMNKPTFSKGFYSRGDIFSETTWYICNLDCLFYSGVCGQLAAWLAWGVEGFQTHVTWRPGGKVPELSPFSLQSTPCLVTRKALGIYVSSGNESMSFINII